MLHDGCRSLKNKAQLMSDRVQKPPETGTLAAEGLEPLLAVTIQL